MAQQPDIQMIVQSSLYSRYWNKNKQYYAEEKGGDYQCIKS